MYAVIVSGGKQYRVAEGDTLKIEKLDAEKNSVVDFDKVLLVGHGESVHIGAPYIDGAKVSAEVIDQGRGKKIKIVKLRRRKNSRRQAGHRQYFTEVKITAIAGA